MKQLQVVVILLLLAFDNAAQNNPITYTEVVKVDSIITADELYNRARLWFAETYKDANSVLQISDKQAGELVGKGNMKHTPSSWVGTSGVAGFISYTIKINVKDGRYKYQVSKFYHEGTRVASSYGNFGPYNFGLLTDTLACPSEVRVFLPRTKWWDEMWAEIKSTVNEEMAPMITSLKQTMNKPSVKKDDW